MTAGTTSTRDFGEQFDDYGRRISLLEQQVGNPDDIIGGSSNEFEEVIIIDPGGINPDVVIRYETDPPTGIGATTTAFLENIYIDISWTAGETDTPDYEIEVSKRTSPGVYEAPRFYRTSGTSIRVLVELANQYYGIKVASINRAGVRSVFSSYLDVLSAIDLTIPPAPTGLAIFAGINSITLVFDRMTPVQAPDMQNGNGLYRIQLSSDNFASVTTEKFTSANVDAFTGLVQGTTYKVRVAAVDPSGNQGPYATSSGITPGYVTDTVIQAGTITGDRIVAASITGAEIQAGSVNGDRITANTLNANRITTSTLSAADITISGGALVVGTPITGTGALINSQGIRLYKAAVMTAILDAVTGNVSVTGSITGTQFTLVDGANEVARLQTFASGGTHWPVTSAGLELDHGTDNSAIRWTQSGTPARVGIEGILAFNYLNSSRTVFPSIHLYSQGNDTSAGIRALGFFGIRPTTGAAGTAGIEAEYDSTGEVFCILKTNRPSDGIVTSITLGSNVISGANKDISITPGTSGYIAINGRAKTSAQMTFNTVNNTGDSSLAQIWVNDNSSTFTNIAMHVGSYTPQMQTSSGGDLGKMRFVNANSSAYINLAAAAFDVSSSARWKREIKAWPGRAIGAKTMDALTRLNQIEVVSYKLLDDVLNMTPQKGDGFDRKDGSFDNRRLQALSRLNQIRKARDEQALGVKHQCGVHCEGSDEHPCSFIVENTGNKIGFTAEQMAEVFPEAVTYDNDGVTPRGLSLMQLIALNIASTQELSTQLSDLHEQVQSLKDA